jgi:hypothetical protein
VQTSIFAAAGCGHVQVPHPSATSPHRYHTCLPDVLWSDHQSRDQSVLGFLQKQTETVLQMTYASSPNVAVKNSGKFSQHF